MEKYLESFYVSLEQYFVYRFSFFLWRIGNVLNLLLTYFLWTSVYSSRQSIFTYSKEQMITYVLLSGLIGSFVFSTRVPELGADILSGKIINYITKPMSLLDYLLAREGADKLMNVAFGITEVVLFIIVLRPHIFIQTDVVTYILLFFFIFLAGTMAFFISYLLAMIAFWSNEVWAPRYIYMVISSILAGTAFPLDILPKFLYELFMLTPFPYLLFIPIKIYLQGLSFNLIKPSIILLTWILILFYFSKFVWNKGMREFSFFGK